MNIRELRATPELPAEYFELRAALEAQVVREPLFDRPKNVALFHAIAALELMVWEMRPIAELEIVTRLLAGLPVEIGTFSMAIHAIGGGITNLVRLLEQATIPAAAGVALDEAILMEAFTALRNANTATDLFIVLNDVELGWRECSVKDRVITVASKSPQRLVRSFQRSFNLEAERNQILTRGDDPRERAMYDGFRATAAQTPDWYDPSPEEVARALGVLLPSWQAFSDPRIPDETMVRGRFTVGQYRALGRALKAYALIQQAVTDFQSPRFRPIPIRRAVDDWIDFAVQQTGIERSTAGLVLDMYVHSGTRDIRETGRVLAPLSHTPFIDCGDGELVLSPTLALWHAPEIALRSIWKSRSPDDYGAKVSAFNHELAAEAAEVFRSKGWIEVNEKQIPGVGDIDAGTGIGGDNFFISAECKVFIDDPVRGADDPAVWRQLDRVVTALRDPDTFRRILGSEGLSPGDVKGLVVVPGRAQIPLDLGGDYALVGVLDLADFVAGASTPRDVWSDLKRKEGDEAVEVREVITDIGDWRLVSDGVVRTDLLR